MLKVTHIFVAVFAILNVTIMATYKVIQDIEAEDKFLGPLTLKQFIFAAVGIFFGYLSFFVVTQGLTFLLAVLLPPMILGIFLAIPWSSEQPTEIWVLAKLRFRLKPQTRIWNQSGLEELVTITVPKKIEKVLTDGLNQVEVESRLKALAETIDSRGWATKNATLMDSYNGGASSMVSERLINPATLPREVPDFDVNSYTDVLDENNGVSENFQQMIQTSSQVRRQQSLDKMERIRRGEPLESINQPTLRFTPPTENIQQLDEQLLTEQLRTKRQAGDIANSNMRTISSTPRAAQPVAAPAAPTGAAQPLPEPVLEAQAGMTMPVNADILDLSQNNDLNIATIARQSHKNDTDNEVVVSLR